MNRRDFLLFRTAAGKRVLQVSCERLYMRAVDSAAAGSPDGIAPQDGWLEEPPRVVALPTVDDLFDDLGSALRNADVLRLLNPEWLASAELKYRFENAIADFRACGGVIETVASHS
jgi:hypothetical protein